MNISVSIILGFREIMNGYNILVNHSLPAESSINLHPSIRITQKKNKNIERSSGKHRKKNKEKSLEDSSIDSHRDSLVLKDKVILNVRFKKMMSILILFLD